jgi:acetyl-CoA acetyltransferase
MGSELAATRISGDPVARIAGRGAAALEPPMFGYAPVAAAEIALRRAGITWREVGAVELNEAFAVQSLVCIDPWGVDLEIVNTRRRRNRDRASTRGVRRMNPRHTCEGPA